MNNQETIQWRPWETAAFELAKKEAKPIFLSISANWCHWCHVMDEEGFTHPEVIRRVNTDFIPVRVDSDKRPDINNRYNMGGWPTVAILNAEGDVVAGGTYMPTGQLLSMLSDVKREYPRRIQGLPEQGTAALTPFPPIDESIVQTVAGFLERAFDQSFGGFGGPPKFPQPWAIELLFHLQARTGEKKWLEMATLTLDHMREGGLYDPVDGGFFRYSASDDWDNPHYEKLLETNALMLYVYLKAYQLGGELTYRATAQGVLDYLFATLSVEGQAWFCGSQSADQDYYTLPEEDRVWADSPSLDHTIYTDRNAMAASGLLAAYHGLGDSKYQDAALKLIDFLWEHCYLPSQGMYHFDDGKLSLCGYISDQVYMMLALMDAFEATGLGVYLDRAEILAKLMDRHLWDREQNGYWDLPVDLKKADGALKVRVKPFVENAVASMALTRLFHLTGQETYRRSSQALLGYLSTVFKAYKHQAAPYAVAVERFLQPPHHVTIVGKREDPRWAEMLRASHLIKTPWKVVVPLDAKQDLDRVKSLGYPSSDEPLAYVCVGKNCLPPVSRPEDFA
ncbi:MAG: thioredoxin domain-containing protein, partial [Nitrospiria bacterium]